MVKSLGADYFIDLYNKLKNGEVVTILYLIRGRKSSLFRMQTNLAKWNSTSHSIGFHCFFICYGPLYLEVKRLSFLLRAP